jgi:hypothetical protein
MAKGQPRELRRRSLIKIIDFATHTDLISETWSELTTLEYNHIKGLHKENPFNNITNIKLSFNALAALPSSAAQKIENIWN